VGAVTTVENAPVMLAVAVPTLSPGSATPSASKSKNIVTVEPSLKFEPITVIDVPGEPLVGVMLIDGVGTVNVAEASKDPPNGTSALMLYVPAATSGTVRVAVNAPDPSAVTGTFGSPGSTAPLSFVSNQTTPEADAAKPEPLTVTEVPGGPLVGLKDIEGDANTGAMSNSIGTARSNTAAIAAVDALVRNIFPFIAFCEVLLVYNLLLSRGVPRV
jgi:hypothetical protein